MRMRSGIKAKGGIKAKAVYQVEQAGRRAGGRPESHSMAPPAPAQPGPGWHVRGPVK